MAPLCSLSGLLSAAVDAHGAGAVYTILEAVGKCHVLHIEAALHGCFIKAHYRMKPKSAPSSPSTRTASVPPTSTKPSFSATPSLPNRYCRDSLLRLRPAVVVPPGLQVSAPKCVKVFDMAKDDTRAPSVGVMYEEADFAAHFDNIAIKNTFIHVDDANDTSSVCSARSARSAPGGFERILESTALSRAMEVLVENEKEKEKDVVRDRYREGALPAIPAFPFAVEREKENEEEMEHAKEKEMEKKVEVLCRSGVEQSLPRGHVASAGVQTVPLRRPRRCRVNGRAVQTEAENDEPDVDASVDGKDAAAAIKMKRNYRGF